MQNLRFENLPLAIETVIEKLTLLKEEIKTLMNFLNVNGTLDKSLLTKPPFNETSDDGIIGLFEEKDVRNIVSLIDVINHNAG